MIRKLLILVCAAVFSCNLFAQTFTRAGVEVPLNGLSKNGKWAFGSKDGIGSFLYDVDKNNMYSFGDIYYADGVSDNGILVGSAGDSAAVCNAARKWVPLPMPEGVDRTGSTARSISADGSLICGYYGNSKTGRKPCIWTLQPDGSYLFESLPTLDKDLTGRSPQGVDPLRFSADGQIIAGRLVDYSGGLNMPMYWKKNAQNKWESVLLCKDLIFKEGAVIPTIPEYPDTPEAMSYFTPADSVRYKKALADYKENPQGDNPEWNQQNYITHPDSINKFNKDAAEYNAVLELIEAKNGELFNVMTNNSIDVFSIALSGNGQYIASTFFQLDPDSNPLEGGGFFCSPMSVDTKTGKAVILDFVKNGIADGITDNGDFFYATPYMERARTSFVLPSGSKTPVELTQWVYQKSKGALDIKPELLFTFEYIDPVTWETCMAVDSLITGDICPSSDGSVFLGYMLSPTEGYFNYIVDFNKPQSIENVEGNEGLAIYPNPAKDFIYLRGDADRVCIVDLMGRTVYESSSVSGSVPVGSLGNGTYLVRLSANGKTTAYKIVVAN